MLLSASLGCLCSRRWQAFEGARLPMQALRYFLSQGSLFTKPDSRALVAVLLTLWHRLRCLECHQPRTSHYCQPQTWNLATYHSLASSLWYLVLARIQEKHYKSSISWIIRACKFICLLDVILEKDRETWLPACDSALFWGACYSTRLYYPGHNFEA